MCCKFQSRYTANFTRCEKWKFKTSTRKQRFHYTESQCQMHFTQSVQVSASWTDTCTQSNVPLSYRSVLDVLAELPPLFDQMLFQTAGVSNSGLVNTFMCKHVDAAPPTPRSQPGWELRSWEFGGFIRDEVKTNVLADDN